MYGGVADTDSEVVFLGLAPDGGRRSLASESASLGSTPGASLGSTTFASTQSVMKSGLGTVWLLHLSESPRIRLSCCPSPLRRSTPAESCPRDIVNCGVPIAQPSARASSAPVHAEFSTAARDQEGR
jgi:hypothetical protein